MERVNIFGRMDLLITVFGSITSGMDKGQSLGKMGRSIKESGLRMVCRDMGR